MSENIGQFSGSMQFGPQLQQFGPQLHVPNSQVQIRFSDTIEVWQDNKDHPNGGCMVPLPIKVVAIVECPEMPE